MWSRRGGPGRALVRVCDALADGQSPAVAEGSLPDDVGPRLSEVLRATRRPARIGVPVQGHRADAVLRLDDDVPIIVDRGPGEGVPPPVHLRRMLRRRALLGQTAVRLPEWLLFDHDAARDALARPRP